MAIGIKWRVEAVFIPDGAGQMEVPTAQTLIQNNDFGANSGIIRVAGGNSPTAAQVQTACTTAGTNMGTALSSATNLAIIQGWISGTG